MRQREKTGRETERQRETKRDRETERERQTERERHRERERERERERHREMETDVALQYRFHDAKIAPKRECEWSVVQYMAKWGSAISVLWFPQS